MNAKASFLERAITNPYIGFAVGGGLFGAYAGNDDIPSGMAGAAGTGLSAVGMLTGVGMARSYASSYQTSEIDRIYKEKVGKLGPAATYDSGAMRKASIEAFEEVPYNKAVAGISKFLSTKSGRNLLIGGGALLGGALFGRLYSNSRPNHRSGFNANRGNGF